MSKRSQEKEIEKRAERAACFNARFAPPDEYIRVNQQRKLLSQMMIVRESWIGYGIHHRINKDYAFFNGTRAIFGLASSGHKPLIP